LASLNHAAHHAHKRVEILLGDRASSATIGIDDMKPAEVAIGTCGNGCS
jgi:hypothetical protein